MYENAEVEVDRRRGDGSYIEDAGKFSTTWAESGYDDGHKSMGGGGAEKVSVLRMRQEQSLCTHMVSR